MSGGPFLICKRRCDQCLFTNNKIVPTSTAKEVVANCLTKDSFFVCHKSPPGANVCCRGFWDKHKWDTLTCRLALAFDLVTEVEVGSLPNESASDHESDPE